MEDLYNFGWDCTTTQRKIIEVALNRRRIGPLLPDDYKDYGLKILRDTLEKLPREGKNIAREVADCYLRMATFIRDDSNCCPRDLIIFTLRAMRYGSAEARQSFPHLLYMNVSWPDYTDLFLYEVRFNLNFFKI